MSLDDQRGLVYLPVGTPSNDFYGARRPGQNLYGDSIVCLDAATGKLKWYFQVAHHGLWDYDPASAPAIVSMKVDGRAIDGVVQLTKQGFVFVFDRVTGKPVWPIEERPAPASDVDGEHAWPTQPFPTRPVPISPQGMTLDEAFNLTPALEAAAKEELKKYRLGPIYTPPSIQGSFQRPGVIGGANWGGSAFNAETGMLFVKTSHSPAIIRLVPGAQANARPGETDAEFAGAQGNTSFTVAAEGGRARGRPPAARAAAVRRSGRDQSEHRRHRLARAVRRHAVAQKSSGAARTSRCRPRLAPPARRASSRRRAGW